jgi:uroporphyrinogen decarboxylase
MALSETPDAPEIVSADTQPRFLRALAHETLDRPPIWFMRQAGRSLPEYRQLRTRAQDFISFCHDPEMAAEATLQPMRRFPFDAAIVFADILLIPGALGQRVWFETGEGPRLGDLPSIESMEAEVEASTGRLSAIGETIRRVRAALEPERALIGFAGAPWTVATYMIEGRGSDRVRARTMAFTDPEGLDRLIAVLVDATIRYLAMQVEAGAQALQLFESWAELLPEDVFERIVTRPHAAIVKGLRDRGIDTPIIGFPRGAGSLVEPYAAGAGVQGVGLDVQATAAVGQRLQKTVTIQGALDPLLLRAGGEALDRRVDQLLEQWGGGPYIFNLGHGVIPDTPVEHIARVAHRVTGR